jgi:hypothetical protein
MTTTFRFLAAIAVAAASGAIASAQEAPPDAAQAAPPANDRRPRPWSLQIEPAVWFAAFGGDVNIGGAGDVDVETLDVDDPNASPAGELHFRRERWTFTLFGAGVSADDDTNARDAFEAGGIAVAEGDPVSTELDFITMHATVGYRLWNWPKAQPPEGWEGPAYAESDVTIGLDLYAGARLQWMDFEVRSGGGSADGDGAFVQPIIGARIELELTRQFSVDLGVDAGWWPGDSMGSTSVSVIVGFQWRPWENVGFQIGFRQMFINLEDEDTLEFDGSLGGLMGSIVLRF